MIDIEKYSSKISNDDIDDMIRKSNINPLKRDISGKCYIEQFRQLKVRGEYVPYLISSFGRIFSIYYGGSNYINIKQLKTRKSKRGYEVITLHNRYKKKPCQIHVLVAECFLTKSNDNQNQVNHINGIKTDNFIWNLEWCTPQENAIHAEVNNLRHHAKGESHGRNKHSAETIHRVCKMLESNNYTISEISKETGLIPQMVMNIFKKKAWCDISKEYNIDNFTNYDHKSEEYKEKCRQQLCKVCELLQSNMYSIKEISRITGISDKIVSSILHNKKYIIISRNYDFSNYTQNKNKK